MEEAQENQKNESKTEEAVVSQPEPKPAALLTEEKEAVTQPQVVVTPEAESPQQKRTIEGTKPSFLRKYGLAFLLINAILILVLAVMGVSYWRMSQTRGLPSPTPTPTASPTPSEEADAQTSALEEQGTSDEIEEIESDLNATDLSEIDKELEEIEAELTE